mgnify:CR=1|jgi:hypothetical protein|tara:strand:- start:7 stop:156 length:150 start_codon:yes stop_codon:yes gene_type:complete
MSRQDRIKQLHAQERYLKTLNGNTSSIKMKKYAVEQNMLKLLRQIRDGE